jgi:D-3-phosphoglycerate dehydrogenase
MNDNGRFKVVVADKVSPSGLQALTDDARFEVVFTAGGESGALVQALAAADALIVRSATKVTSELLAGAPVLRAIGRAGVGVDNIDLAAATARGVPVLNAPEGNTVSAAELTFALVLATARHVPAADRSVRAGEWRRSRFAGSELRGKTLGLVGAGRIGGEVVKRARGFGMRVVVHDPYLSEERATRLGVSQATLGEVLERADVVSLHVPLTKSTEGMIGAEELARMKPTALIVNVSRGGVLEEDALADALTAGRLAGAALDVFASEPLAADSPLREAPNLILTPHLGASTAEAQELVAGEIAEAVKAALLHGDLSRAVNAPAIGGEALARLRPLLDLAKRAGRLARAITNGGLQSVEIRYAGDEAEGLSSLLASTLVGLLSTPLGRDRVNFVNAAHLARERGIRLSTTRSEQRSDYSEYLEVRIHADSGRTQVAGALLEGQHPRLVRVDGYRVDIVPHGTLIVLRNRDVPGVIGCVGTILGRHGLNIAEYHQARPASGGDALAAISVDGEVSADLVSELLAMDEVMKARAVELG